MFKKNEKEMNKIKEKLNNNIFVFKASYSSLKEEGRETIEAISIIIQKTKRNKDISEADINKVKEQLKDIGKMSTLLPLIVLPGSPITIPILYKLADKFNIDLIPSSFKDIKDKIELLKLSKEQKTNLNNEEQNENNQDNFNIK